MKDCFEISESVALDAARWVFSVADQSTDAIGTPPAQINLGPEAVVELYELYYRIKNGE